MTDFDAKLAELEDQSDRVPELKIVVELFRMLKAEIARQSGVSDRNKDDIANLVGSRALDMKHWGR